MTCYQITLTVEEINALSDAVAAASHRWLKAKHEAEESSAEDREATLALAESQHRIFCRLMTSLNNAPPVSAS